MTQLFHQLLHDMDPRQRFVLCMLAIVALTGFLIATVALAMTLANVLHRRRLEDALKRTMLDRCMTADEVARVIESTARLED